MAYAAVVSLAQILKQLLQPDNLSVHYPKPQLQSLHENLSSLKTSLERFVLVPKNKRDGVKELEIKISNAIYEAQDTIESFISKQSETEENPEGQARLLQKLQEIIKNISPITKETEEISDSIRKQTGDSLSEDTRSGKSNFSTKIKIVGQDEDRKKVMDELKSDTNERQIVPIIGMPGIGKTTLARSIYEHQDVENHFNIRAWVTVSSDFNVRDIFLKLHASMVSRGQKSDDSGSMKNIADIVNQERADLAVQLYQKLYDTRYLVVIDDMWDTKVWDALNSHFPDRKNGSRIILTTRDGNIADYIVKSTEFRRVMTPLGDEDSWTLLCGKVYEEGDSKAQCPPNLEKIGRSIAKNCLGLPLSLTVVGGLLAQNKIEEHWKFIEVDTKAAAAKDEEAYKDILSLSYTHLPNRLKGCFLYMGAFPEDSEILVSKLIKLWVAEGFLAPGKPSPPKSKEQVTEGDSTTQPPPSPESSEQVVEGVSTLQPPPSPDSSEQVVEGVSTPQPSSSPKSSEHVVEGVSTRPPSPPKTLEQVAQQYLEDLVARNLISVRRNTSNGHIKTCGIHDTIRDLAVEESGNVKFFHAINKYAPILLEGAESRRRLSVHKNILLCVEEVYNSAKLLTLARTLLCAGPHHHHPMPYSLAFDLLRVLDALSVYFIEFPDEVIKLIHLRYLSFTYNGKLPSLLSKLENLQVLIVRQYPKIIFIGASILPVEIWYMPQLRHLLVTETELPPIPSGLEFDAQNSVLLQNLQTLTNVNASCCTKEVLQNIPKLKKLGIWVESPEEAVNFYLDVLKQLEALTFTVLNPDPDASIEFLPKLDFPKTLRKLSLNGCCIPWEEMKVIADLPDLQVLKLRELAFKGEEWIMDGMIFHELKFLLLEYVDVKYWGATDDYDQDKTASCFPSLKQLMIRHCYEMEGIPEDIGDIGGLELIELVDCSPLAMESAKEIRDKQKEYKIDLQVRIYCSWE